VESKWLGTEGREEEVAERRKVRSLEILLFIFFIFFNFSDVVALWSEYFHITLICPICEGAFKKFENILVWTCDELFLFEVTFQLIAWRTKMLNSGLFLVCFCEVVFLWTFLGSIWFISWPIYMHYIFTDSGDIWYDLIWIIFFTIWSFLQIIFS